MKISNFLLLGCFASLTLTYSTINQAHSGDSPIRFVSSKGLDEGVCNNPSFPCKSIEYAVNQATKGDKVHVAEGVYAVKGLDIFFLLLFLRDRTQ